jgi:hypothetical protein
MKTKLFRLLAVVCTALFVVSAAPQANGQLTFSLSPVDPTGSPFDTVTLSGTLTNSTADLVSLFGGSGVVVGPGAPDDVVWDDTDFLNNLPLSLAPDETYQHDILLKIAGGAVAGVYSATYSVEGEGGSPTEPLEASDTVRLTVAPASSVPEANSLALLTGGLGGMVALRLLRARRRLSTGRR